VPLTFLHICPVASALGSQLRELVLVLAPGVDARTRGRLLSALAKTAEGLEVLELRLEGKSDEVRGSIYFVVCLIESVC
jgi:hypothetical protein